MKRGRPRIPKREQRPKLSIRVAPETMRRLKQIARAEKISLGKLIDRYVAG